MFGSKSQVGISISDRTIEMLGVRLSRKGAPTLVAYSASEQKDRIISRGHVKDVDRLAAALMDTYKAAKPKSFPTKDVVLVLPEEVTLFHIFHFPGQLNEKELFSTVAFEAEEIFPYSIKELATTFSVLNRTETETEILFAAVPKDVLNPYVKAVEQADLHLQGVGLESQSLTAALIPVPQSGKATMIIDYGTLTTTVIVADSIQPRASFSHPYGGSHITKLIAEAENITPLKAEMLKRKVGIGKKASEASRKATKPYLDQLAKDVKAAIKWYESNHKAVVDEIIETGGGSLLLGLKAELEARLRPWRKNIQVKIGDPWTLFPKSHILQEVKKQGPLFTPALGAALEYIARRNQLVNFLETEQRSVKSTKPSKAKQAVTKKTATTKKAKSKLAKIPQTKELFAKIFKPLLIILLIVLLGAGAYITNYFYPISLWFGAREEAEIVPMIEPAILEGVHSTTVAIDSTGQDPDAVTARFIQQSIEETVTVTPEVTNEIEGIATGTVTLINDSISDQPLVATTRLISEEGVLFRLTNAAFVPAFGSIEADVYADKPGAQGDIGPTRFTIPGLAANRQKEVYAMTDSPMQGGIRSIGILSNTDIEEAKADIEEQIYENLMDYLNINDDKNETMRSDVVEVIIADSKPSVPVGTEVETAEITIFAQIKALLYPEDDLINKLYENAAKSQEITLAALKEQTTMEILSVSVVQKDEGISKATLEITYKLNPQ